MIPSKLKSKVKKLPNLPGVYIYKNSAAKVIYVGKAINLKKRVTQYFLSSSALGPKTRALVSQIASIEIKLVDSEIEALILESSLIKKHHPKYNSQLKDDKSYIYINISRQPLPQVSSVHFNKIRPRSFVYGPFPNTPAVKSLLKTIRRRFPFYTKKHHPSQKCLYCHLHLCPGPTPDPKLYRQNIGKIKKILSGNFKKLQTQLKREIKKATKVQDFELAILARDQLSALNYIVGGWKSLSFLYSSINLPSDTDNIAVANLLTLLQPYFSGLKKISRIEAYDVSNLGSNHFTAAMSVFDHSHLDHSQYRQFKIYTKSTPDDQFMMAEALSRRLRHQDWPLPDLILVDGGKPQVTAAVAICHLPIIGLAKKEETVVFKVGDNWQQVNLPPSSHSLRLLQNLRNEAHRFANRYRKKLIQNQLK